jgi:hypothetical protein
MPLLEPLQALLKRLALIAGGLSASGASAVAADLRMIPERSIENVIEESEEPDWDAHDRLHVLGLLALDPRPSVRLDVATSLTIKPESTLPDEAEALVGVLASDPDPEVQYAAAADLLALLTELPPLERTDLVCRWATDADPTKRLAVATALQAPIEVVGARTALEHLARDASPSIRAAAVASRSARRR